MKIIIAILFLAWTCSADYCGGNCPSGNCPTCPCGKNLSLVNAADICKKYSWNQTCCKCIINSGSGGNANYVGYSNSSSSERYYVGLFTINSLNWKYCTGEHAPCSVDDNLNCAIVTYNSQGGWGIWSAAQSCGCIN